MSGWARRAARPGTVLETSIALAGRQTYTCSSRERFCWTSSAQRGPQGCFVLTWCTCDTRWIATVHIAKMSQGAFAIFCRPRPRQCDRICQAARAHADSCKILERGCRAGSANGSIRFARESAYAGAICDFDSGGAGRSPSRTVTAYSLSARVFLSELPDRASFAFSTFCWTHITHIAITIFQCHASRGRR